MSVIIDGAVPRNPNERCMVLLDYAHDQVLYHAHKNWAFEKWCSFHNEVTWNWDDDEHDWYDLEDEIIDWINEMLPDDVLCCLHPDDPGTVVVWNKEEVTNEIG